MGLSGPQQNIKENVPECHLIASSQKKARQSFFIIGKMSKEVFVPQSHKKHILVVEDSQDLQNLLSQLLISENFQLSQAYDGQEALNLLQKMESPPALILLDVMMPVMGGIEFLKERLKDPKIASIPVIVMTADSSSKSKAALLCANEFVQKPINDIDELLETVHRITDNP